MSLQSMRISNLMTFEVNMTDSKTKVTNQPQKPQTEEIDLNAFKTWMVEKPDSQGKITAQDFVQPAFTRASYQVQALAKTRAAQRAMSYPFKEGPTEVMKGKFSNDRDFLQIKGKLSSTLTEMFPASVDDETGTVYGNGVKTNFMGMRAVNGFRMIPGTWPITDNHGLRADDGLSNEFKEKWHENIVRAMIKLMIDGMEPCHYSIAEGKSSCFPLMTKDSAERYSLSAQAIKDYRAAGNLILKGQDKEAYELYSIGGAYIVVYRAQSSDAVLVLSNKTLQSKDRKVAEFIYAMTGGKRGKIVVADKSFDSNPDMKALCGNEFFRERLRTAFGCPGSVSAVLGPIAQSMRKNLFKKFPLTFHHKTRAKTQEDLRTLQHIIMCDVTQHDQYWWQKIGDIWSEEFVNAGFDPAWVAIFSQSLRLPVYVTSVGPDQGSILLGDWANPNLSIGLPSGNPFTDLLGTGLMAPIYAIVQIEHTMPHLAKQLEDPVFATRWFDSYLRWREPICQKSKSDDCALGWKELTQVNSAKKLHRLMKTAEGNDRAKISPYMLITYEHGGAYLGNILLFPRSGDPKGVRLIGNINSMLNNAFSPEYGVQSGVRDRSKRARPFAGLAWGTIREHYGTVPVFGEVSEQIEKIWYDVYGESYTLYRECWMKEDQLALEQYVKERSIGDISSLTTIEREVLADRDKLSYKYTNDDVRPEVLSILFKGIRLEDGIFDYFNQVTGLSA
nr:MAG: putative RNA-dependent RNA polymerase [Yunnan sediment cysto-like virus 2]